MSKSLKMLKRLLLASAMLLSIGASAHAESECGYPSYGGVHPCWEDSQISFEFDELTAEERTQIAEIRARVDKRTDAKWAAEQAESDAKLAIKQEQQAIENIRLSQCTGILLWKKCPPRTLEAERFWAH